jgi:hypothetical protein
VRRSSAGPYIAVLGLALGCGSALAADTEAASKCATIGDDPARLACYDAIFRTAAGGTASGAAAAAAAPAAAATATSPGNPNQDFGLTPARKESIEAAQSKATGTPAAPKEPAVPDSITARVVTAARRMTGELVVILDNGQVWVQIDTEVQGRVKEGDEVTIRKGTLGSYLLVTPNHILVRVRRVK